MQRYLENQAGGIIGKVFSNKQHPCKARPTGKWKCKDCGTQFTNAKGLCRHKKNQVCKKRIELAITT